MINILHVFSDDKFFDVATTFFDAIPDVNNIYIYYTRDRNYRFNYIKNYHRIVIVTNKKEYFNYLRKKDINIVYFHSLSPSWYKYVLKIHRNVKVIWWIWGYDIYNKWRHCEALIPISLYKPITQSIIDKKRKRKNLIVFFREICYTLLYWRDIYIRKKAIARVDYVSPVIDLEYKLLVEKCPFFRAEPFMINSGPGIATFPLFARRKPLGNILIGNSLTLTNNHLDIFDAIKGCDHNSTQKYIIPISYGSDLDKSILKENFPHYQVLWLEDWIPKDEYNMTLATVSYAIFGVIRQQAMGNIAYCLKNGVKIFLYSDSILYNYLISKGYVIFKIEDIRSNSFDTPLEEEAAMNNYMILKNSWTDNVNYAYNEILRVVNK